MSKYQKFNTYGKLRSVLLGSYFSPSFFASISDPLIRKPLERLAVEINEDLDYFETVLKNYGCQVIRAPRPEGVLDYDNVYHPPLQVRNTHCVVGNTMYQLNPSWYNDINPILTEYCPDIVSLVNDNELHYHSILATAKENYNAELDLWYSKSKYIELAGSDWPPYADYVKGTRSSITAIDNEMESFKNDLVYETKELGPLQGPNVINTEHTVYVDAIEYCDYTEWLKFFSGEHRTIKQFTSKAGHIDGCFAVIGKNLIIGIDPLIDYKKYFPGYHVIRVPTKSYMDQIDQFKLMKEKVNGRWWIAGEEHNDIFIKFVESTLKDWVGYVEESIFDVNVLPLDEHTLCVSNILPEIEEELKSHGITCIHIPWRHRFFVDGGLHCITLDLFRDR